jgi:hypothetical protein
MFRSRAIRAVQSRHENRVEGLASGGLSMGLELHTGQNNNGTSIATAAGAAKGCSSERELPRARGDCGDALGPPRNRASENDPARGVAPNLKES